MDIVQTCFKQQPGLGLVAFTDLVIRSSHTTLGVLWGTLHVIKEVKVRTVEKAGRNHPRTCVSNCILRAGGSVVHSPIYVRETSLQQELG